MNLLNRPVDGRLVGVLAVLVVLALPGVAQALPTQTWVSGVGNDANPCSRTAPCKTFAGAISKTETGGLISVIDPGGFGAVTITKAITIDAGSVFAGVLVSGTNGIVVNAPGQDVTLRGLTIEYAPPCTTASALNGVLLQAGNLSVQDVGVHGFPEDAIDAKASAAGSSLSVTGSDLRDNCTGGIAASTTAGHLSATLSDNFIGNDGTGVSAGGGSQVSISDNTIVDNAVGLAQAAGASLSSTDDNRLAGNGTNGASPVELVSPFAPPAPTPIVTPVATPVAAPLPATCRVPKLSGDTLAKARKTISKATCVLGAVSYRTAKHKRRGLIYAQQPKAGTLQLKGAIVNVTLDGRPAPAKKPRARRALSGGASRTWVSGVGEDANPCSREAPCRTFAGALAKTAAGGTVDALDPGDFGQIVLSGSDAGTVTIQGNPGATIEAPAGSTGIVVNSGPGANVILRDLNVISTPGCSAAGSGSGIEVLSGANLHLEDLRVSGFPDTGLKIEPSAGMSVTLHGSTFYDNCGTGISAQGASGVNVTTDGTQVLNDPVGVAVGTGAVVRLANTTISGSATALSTSGTGAVQGWPDNSLAGNAATGATPTLLGFI